MVTKLGRPALYVAAAALGAAVVAAVGLRSADGDGESRLLPPLSADRELAARATITPRAHMFGDTVYARVHVVLDRKRVDPDDLHLSASFQPYERTGEFRREQRDFERLTYIRFTIGIRCVARACLSVPVRRVIGLERAQLRYRAVERRNGEQVVRVPWPRVAVGARVLVSPDQVEEIGQLAGELAWRADLSDLPKPSYRVSPGVLGAGLGTASLALFVLGGLIATRELRRRPLEPVRPVPVAKPLPPLEHALAALDAARAAGTAGDQRKALESLSRELAFRGNDELAAAAKQLAWSALAPAAEATAALSSDVWRLIEEEKDAPVA